MVVVELKGNQWQLYLTYNIVGHHSTSWTENISIDIHLNVD